MTTYKPKFYRVLILFLCLILIVTSLPLQDIANATSKINTSDSPAKEEDIHVEITEDLVEIEELRTQNAKVFLNEEGTYVAEVFMEPIHYWSDDQTWKEIDNTLSLSSDGQYFENKENKFSVKFQNYKKNSGEDKSKLFSYSVNNHQVELELVQEEDSEHNVFESVVKNNQITFLQPFDQVDIEYIVDGTRVKGNIILHSYTGKNTFEYLIKTEGLNAAKQEDGSIHFLNNENEFQFLIEKPYMYDSNYNVGPNGVISEQVTQEIRQVENDFILTITADEDFLTSDERVYPVVIDPWIDVFQAQDTFISSLKGNDNFHQLDHLLVGYHSNYGITRSLLKWPLPSIPNGVVTSASLGVYQTSKDNNNPINVHKVLSNINANTVTWNTPITFSTDVYATSTHNDIGYSYFNVTKLVKEWYDTPSSNMGLLLKYPNTLESGTRSNNNKSFNSSEFNTSDGGLFSKPKLVIEFRPTELLGITDYWTYTPDIFNGEGTGVVNVINGNMVYDIPLLSLPGRTGKFNLNLVYNSRSNFSGAYGLGWMFSAQPTVLPNADRSIIEYRDPGGTRYHFSKQQHDDKESYSSPEGTHMWLTRTNTGYELTYSDETVFYFDSHGRNYEIKDEKGNRTIYEFENATSNRVVKIKERFKEQTTGRDIILVYNANGLLDKVTDFRGTETKLSYDQINGVNRLRGITYGANRSGNEKKTISFTYHPSTNRLFEVIDAVGNKGSIFYDSLNRVSKITDPRSESINVEFIYNDLQTIYKDARGNKTLFEYSNPNRATVNVTKMIEGYESEAPATTTYEWKQNLLIKEIGPDKQTGAINENSTTVSLDYDNKGNVESVKVPNNLSVDNNYDTKSNLLESKQSSGVYERHLYDEVSNLITTTTNFSLTNFNSYDDYGNIKKASTPTRANHNRLVNSSFESSRSGNLPASWNNFSTGTYSLSTQSKHGKSSARITLSATEAGGYYTQNIPVLSEESQRIYTVATQIKAENVTGEGARIRIFPLDANNRDLIDPNTNQRISYETDAINGNTDWIHISETFTLDPRTANLRVDLLFRGTGTVYFDGAQVMFGTTLNEYHSNENVSFEHGNGTVANGWDLNVIGSGDGRTTERRMAGSHSFKVTGSSSTRHVGQTVEVKGKKGDPITFSGWANTTSVSTSGNFGLRLWLSYTDGSTQQFNIPFMKGDHVVNEWQFVKDTIFAEKDFHQAKIYGIYGARDGIAYFENIKVEETGSVSETTYSLDGNFIISETDGLNNKRTYEHDQNGNQTLSVDPAGKATSFQYDFLDRLKMVTLVSPNIAENISIEYVYDSQGNIRERIDPKGNKTIFDYNEINKVEKETDSLGKYIEYDYDEEGNVKRIQKGRGSTLQSEVTFTYDAKNNELAKLSNGTKMYEKTYYRNNLLKTILSSDGTLYTFEYDQNSRLTDMNLSEGYKLSHIYQNEQNKPDLGKRLSYSETVNGKTEITSYKYDGLQRITSLTGPTGGNTEFFYDEISQVVRMKSGSTTQHQAFNGAGQLINQIIVGKDILQLGYTYFPNGDVKTYKNGNTLHQYTYDFAGRLDSWSNGTNIVSYQYDKAGNLLNPNGKTLAFNSANEVIGYNYDEAGNLLKDSRHQYTWDGLDQLRKVSNLNGITVAEYTYHPDGLRKTKKVGNATFNYYYDDTDLIRITDQTGKTVWALTWNNGEPISLTNGKGESFFYVTNRRGDVIRIVDNAGNTVASYEYDPWGNAVHLNENPVIQNQPILYAGYVYDRETSLYYLQARYYDPTTARFISRDPILGDENHPFSQNSYAYAMNNPVMFTDPDGNLPVVLVPIVVNVGGRMIVHYVAKKGAQKAVQQVASKSVTNGNQFLSLNLQFFARGKVNAWIQRNIFNEIKNKLGKEAAQKFANAMKKGYVNNGKGDNGIKKLSGNGLKVGNKYYQFEIKITGRYGNARVYGNYDQKSGNIIFSHFVKSH